MSRQFDVVRNPDEQDAAHRPHLIVLQSNLVDGLRSTVVAPLVSHGQFTGAPRLNPAVTVKGRQYWLATHELFAIDQRVLKGPIASLESKRDIIIGALDFLFIGF